MKDSRINALKLRAENDNSITAGACRLLWRICSWRYCLTHEVADSEFRLAWTDIAKWYGADEPETVCNKRTIYAWLRELVHRRYLFYNGTKGCPPRSCYRLQFYFPEDETLFVWAGLQCPKHVHFTVHGGYLTVQKTAQSTVQKTAQSTVHRGTQLKVRKTTPPHNGYSLREEKIKTKGKKIEPRSARERRNEYGMDSLRSESDEGKNDGSLREKPLQGEALKQFMAKCKTDAGLTPS